MGFSKRSILLILLAVAMLFAAAFLLILQYKIRFADSVVPMSKNIVASVTLEKVVPPPQKLVNPPEIVKAVYVTGYSAGSKKYLNYLANLFNTTEINAVVIDIKDYSGLVSYSSGASEVKKYSLYNNAIPDIDALVRFFHDKNIYVIGRIAVFEDPAYAKARPNLAVYDVEKTKDILQPVLWQDNNGLSWLDPASQEVWDYNISIAKDAFYHGFDEINFDYIRFPSDGKIENMGFPIWGWKAYRVSVIKKFFAYTRQQLIGEKISADLFGQTTTNTDDMGIGQIIENAFENFDYISPMIYPSHYINGFMSFVNPAEHPYEVISYSMVTAQSRESNFLKKRQVTLASGTNGSKVLSSELKLLDPMPAPVVAPLAKFRPWLQDFNMGADYTAEMVKLEIKATQDALGSDYAGYMLWNPSNVYTQGALLKPL